mmetsp:Transcript_10160/g.23183  ORF Transcript_10160/g.23183 Transcript_10160/m.23183 type:complete len:235 (+) Transcript_10160:1231-1935(+)
MSSLRTEARGGGAHEQLERREKRKGRESLSHLREQVKIVHELEELHAHPHCLRHRLKEVACPCASVALHHKCRLSVGEAEDVKSGRPSSAYHRASEHIVVCSHGILGEVGERLQVRSQAKSINSISGAVKDAPVVRQQERHLDAADPHEPLQHRRQQPLKHHGNGRVEGFKVVEVDVRCPSPHLGQARAKLPSEGAEKFDGNEASELGPILDIMEERTNEGSSSAPTRRLLGGR